MVHSGTEETVRLRTRSEPEKLSSTGKAIFTQRRETFSQNLPEDQNRNWGDNELADDLKWQEVKAEDDLDTLVEYRQALHGLNISPII